MRLKGFEAIERAEELGLRLGKLPGPDNQARVGLTVAEAEAIAAEDEGLIYLDLPDGEADAPVSYRPER